jgi:CDP-4-dehydro-6-deoxyglucose reductase
LTDLVLEAPEAQSPADIPLQQITTRVQRLALARRDILRLYLRTPRSQLLRFFPGQYLTWKLRDLTRDVPIASCPCDGLHLEFHLRYHPGDPFSERVFHGLQKLDRIEIEGPKGRFTLDEASRRPILWVAFDTGFGPIHSLIEHAIHIDLAQPMHLYWHVPRWGEHYMENYCRAWVSSLEDFVYTPLAGEGLARGESGGGKREICSPAEVARRIVADYPDLSGYDLYLVAPDSLVAGARDRFLAHGLPPERLFVAPHYL